MRHLTLTLLMAALSTALSVAAGCGRANDDVLAAAHRQGLESPAPTSTVAPGAIPDGAQLNPNFGGAAIVACNAEKQTLLNALEQLHVMNGGYPTPSGVNGWGPLVGVAIKEASRNFSYTLVDGKPVLDPLGGCVY